MAITRPTSRTRRHHHFLAALVLASGFACGANLVLAHGAKKHAGETSLRTIEQKDFGIAGDPKKVTRTFKVTMLDTMRFVPDTLHVNEGDTVKISLTNKGKLLHEFVIGSKSELDAHAALMAKFPNMEHDEPYMAHVPAGATGSIVWRFNRAGNFDFACLIAGHYQAGMVGKIIVKPGNNSTPKESK